MLNCMVFLLFTIYLGRTICYIIYIRRRETPIKKRRQYTMKTEQKIKSVLKSIGLLKEEKEFLKAQLEKGRTMFVNANMLAEIDGEIEYLQDTITLLKKAAA